MQSRLFIADYEILSDIESKDDRIFYSSIVLLYVNKHSKLLPLAIQLTRNSDSNQIYTPDDREEVWLFARMHATLSDSLVHEMVTIKFFQNLSHDFQGASFMLYSSHYGTYAYCIPSSIE